MVSRLLEEHLHQPRAVSPVVWVRQRGRTVVDRPEDRREVVERHRLQDAVIAGIGDDVSAAIASLQEHQSALREVLPQMRAGRGTGDQEDIGVAVT